MCARVRSGKKLLYWNGPGSVRVDLGALLLFLKQGPRYKFQVHLRLDVLYDAPNLTRTQLEVCARFRSGRKLLHWNGAVVRFRRGLVCKAYRLLYHSTLGSSVKRRRRSRSGLPQIPDRTSDPFCCPASARAPTCQLEHVPSRRSYLSLLHK